MLFVGRIACARPPRLIPGVDMTSSCQVGVVGCLGEGNHLLSGIKARQEAGPATATVDHADIRGLGTTLLVSVGRLPRSRHEDRRTPPLNADEGYATPGPRPLPCLSRSRSDHAS